MLVIRSNKAKRSWIYTYHEGSIYQTVEYNNGVKSSFHKSLNYNTMKDVRDSINGDEKIIHDDNED